MKSDKTLNQYRSAAGLCSDLFHKKMKDYGTAWRILRPSSLTDQLFIKAQRIRTIQEASTQKIAEGEQDEFIGLVNYSVLALIQMELGEDAPLEMDFDTVSDLYKGQLKKAEDLMIQKNHDYGEAWRDMRVSSLTDLILQKLLRVKQIEDNKGKTLVSEGIDANYLDIINYSLFSLIHLNEEN
ncbi:DUF1599 domain-containing protein [Luteibaculum oceani]|uniref:DUF1599 domain-containing protein n=1 Tax=Luteibaculum oceani TaxID=1294296 RepID=A0A5C6UWE0_9FLAO|nr:DUF1599 domain-containing protein [Luteibaculum oceani]TXC76974.1 DUF1599 domain-containing protein [Luteibaculum oceani]